MSETPETVLQGKVHVRSGLEAVPDIGPICECVAVSRHPVSVDGCDLYCEVEGEGTPLVLLHGGPGATHHGFHPWFSRAADFARVVYYDQRGCGRSGYEPGDAGYTISQAVADLDALRESLDVARWVVLGHSYGGLLAQSYAVAHPDRLAGLVLVGASIPAPLKLMRTRQYDFITYEERKRIREIHADPGLSLAQKIYNAHRNGDWKRQSFYRPTREQLGRRALYEWVHDSGFNATMGSQMRSVDLRGAFDDCPVPTLIVEGRWDLTWNVDKPARLHAIHPRARLEMFERSGHSPFNDEPDRFFDLLGEFVAGLGRVVDDEVARWQQDLARWLEGRQASPEHRIRSAGWGRSDNRQTAEAYETSWLDHVTDPWMLVKVGFALYDVERYEDAREVFSVVESAAENDPSARSVALIWQGHLLDLLDRREEALAAYRKAADEGVRDDVMHAQFGLEYKPAVYARQRLDEPFARIENQEP